MTVTLKPVSSLMNQEHPSDRHGGKRKEEGQVQQQIPVYQVLSYREEEVYEVALDQATEVPGLPEEVPDPLLEDLLATTLQVPRHLFLIILSEEVVRVI
jgi:hypothetical protein